MFNFKGYQRTRIRTGFFRILLRFFRTILNSAKTKCTEDIQKYLGIHCLYRHYFKMCKRNLQEKMKFYGAGGIFPATGSRDWDKSHREIHEIRLFVVSFVVENPAISFRANIRRKRNGKTRRKYQEEERRKMGRPL